MTKEFLYDLFISLLYVSISYVWLLVSKSNTIKNSLETFKYQRTLKERNRLKVHSLVVVFRAIIFGILVHFIAYPSTPYDAPLYGSIVIGASSLSAINACIINYRISLKSKHYSDEMWEEFYTELKNMHEFKAIV